jgi:hypothetical protein
VHGGKGPIEKQSREEKTKGGKEQEEERPGSVGIGARTNDWERRFRQEILVAQSASIFREKSTATSSLGAKMSRWERRASPNVIKKLP